MKKPFFTREQVNLDSFAVQHGKPRQPVRKVAVLTHLGSSAEGGRWPTRPTLVIDAVTWTAVTEFARKRGLPVRCDTLEATDARELAKMLKRALEEGEFAGVPDDVTKVIDFLNAGRVVGVEVRRV